MRLLAVIGVTVWVLACPAPGVSAAVAPTPAAGTATAHVTRVLDDWHLAPSLAALRDEVDARWPGRDRSWDGAIGDVHHQRTRNSHNPVGTRNGPDVGTPGAVHSLDLTARGLNVRVVLRAVIGDRRVGYVIHDGQIWSRRTGWAPRPYEGDPHTSHIHVTTIEQGRGATVAAEMDTSRWLPEPGAGRLSVREVRAVQRALIRRGFPIPAGATGKYGDQTTRAMAHFQRTQGWRGAEADGKPGTVTLRRLKVERVKDRREQGARVKAPRSKADSAKADSAKGAVRKGTGKGAVRKGTGKAAVRKGTGKGAVRNAGKGLVKKGAGRSEVTKSKARKAAATSAAGRRSALLPGTSSADVQRLQLALIEAGYPIPAGATGYFGRRTRAAVAAFQRDLGWRGEQADGIPGRGTLRLLAIG